MIRTLLALALVVAVSAPEPVVRDAACPIKYAVVRGQLGSPILCYDGPLTPELPERQP